MRPKINWSPRKREARKSDDVVCMDGLHKHIQEYGLMGTLHDPLQLMAPYINNLKLIYRDVCRIGSKWDDEVSESIKQRVIEALSYFLMMPAVEFPRKVTDSSATEVKFMLFFNGS